MRGVRGAPSRKHHRSNGKIFPTGNGTRYHHGAHHLSQRRVRMFRAEGYIGPSRLAPTTSTFSIATDRSGRPGTTDLRVVMWASRAVVVVLIYRDSYGVSNGTSRTDYCTSTHGGLYTRTFTMVDSRRKHSLALLPTGSRSPDLLVSSSFSCLCFFLRAVPFCNQPSHGA